MKSKNLFFWSKTDIATVLNVDAENLSALISEEIKEKVSWAPGRQKFTPSKVFEIIKSLNELWGNKKVLSIMNMTEEDLL